jgi:hypothetical protein
MFKDKEQIREFINGYIYHLARLIALYLAVFYFTINPQEADE